MSTENQTPKKRHLFKGAYVWSGIAMALVGFLGEEVMGGEHAFEFFSFFGGLNLGMGLIHNQYSGITGQMAGVPPEDGPSA